MHGAGIFPIVPSTGRALVLLRSQYVSDPLTWAPPGGGEDPFDDGQPRWTAVREFIEETGHRPSGHIMPLATVYNPTGPFHLFVSIEPREFEPTLDWENASWLWLCYDELMLLDNKHPGFADMLEYSMVKKELLKLMSGMCFFNTEA
jgi:8-oxo-dGTP pyrophosphatase MutT (NUDIX family)